MQFQVKNFKGCASAEIEVSRIALLIGDGGACKTSILQAIAAAATGEVVPVANVTKTQAGRLLRAGAEKGAVSWVGEEGYETTVEWPKAELKARGSAPFVSVYAAGLSDLLDVAPKKRAPILLPLLKADPTREDVLEALRRARVHQPSQSEPSVEDTTDMAALNLDPGDPDHVGLHKLLCRVWAKVSELGWDKAADQARDMGSELKGQWRGITGQQYGVRAAETWLPQCGWEDDLATAAIETVERAHADAKDALEKAIAARAVRDVDRSDLQAKADELATLDAERIEKNKAVQAASEAYSRLTIKSTPKVPSRGLPCPHCQAAVTVLSDLTGVTGLGKAEPVDDAVVAAAERALEEHRTALAEAKANHEKLFRELLALDERIGSAKQAKLKLAELDSAADASTDVDAAREAARVAGERKAAITSKREADRLHRAIGANQVILDLLGDTAETSVRRTKLRRVVEAFNSGILEPLCETAGWKPVTLNDDLEVEYGGRSFPMLCKSEQHRCRFVMQLALAQADGSALVVMDDADTLPVAGRGGLLKMVASTGLHAVIAMMVPSPDKAPDLAKSKVGRTYWIADGKAQDVADALAAVKKVA